MPLEGIPLPLTTFFFLLSIVDCKEDSEVRGLVSSPGSYTNTPISYLLIIFALTTFHTYCEDRGVNVGKF